MTQQIKKQVELNNFSGGFNTEQSPLNADPSTTMQEQNMILASDGSRARRYGYNTPEANTTGASVKEGTRLVPPLHYYRQASIDVGSTVFEERDFALLWNYENAASPKGYRVLENDGTQIAADDYTLIPDPQYNAVLAEYQLTSTQVGSALLIPHNALVLKVTPNPTYKLVAKEELLYVRDLWGLDDDLDVGERLGTITYDHAYNLVNQGWTADSITKFKTETTLYPSNGDVYYFGLLPTDGVAPELKYDVEALKKVPFPNGAPKGRIRISTAYPDESRVNSFVLDELEKLSTANTLGWTRIGIFTGIGGGRVDSNWLLKSATSYLGRVFYTGSINGEDYYGNGTQRALGSFTPSFNNAVIFSKIVESVEGQVGVNSVADIDNPFMCHSKFDPTNELFAPSASDGGIVFVSGADRILGTTTTRNSLLIIATNGVWELQANDGFSPATFTLFKVLEAYIPSMEGVVTVSDTVMVPTSTGIYAMAYDGQSRRTVTQNVSDKFIRTYYLSKYDWIIDSVYDEARQEVRWLLTTPPVVTDGVTPVAVEQAELVLDMRLGSFSINKFPDTVAIPKDQPTAFPFKRLHYARPTDAQITFPWSFVCRYAKLPKPSMKANGNTPIDTKRNSLHVKLLVADYYVELDPPAPFFRIYETTKEDFRDFSKDPVSAFMVTNPVTMGDTIRRKDMPYVWTHFYRSENGFEDVGGDWIPKNQSGCLMSARWDFSDDPISGKWTTPQQVYRLQRDYLPVDINDPFTYGHSIITTKNNVLGSGKALSIKFESDGNKDMQLIGWGAVVAMNGSV